MKALDKFILKQENLKLLHI